MPDPTLGKTINKKYVLRDVLGAGGMGVVYRAAQLDAAGEEVREVAVKMIRRELSEDSRHDIAKRFHKEVRAAAQLRGPNIVSAYDFGTSEDDELYYVMPLVSGPTLRAILDEHAPLPPERAIRIAEQICQALREAHDLPKPVVHRDLKPANVFVERWPEGIWVRVGDFGIAKILGDDTSGVTHSGVSPGTPRYMAPEQCRGDEVDARSDLYALGVILFEMLTGKPPFGGDQLSIMYQHENRPPPSLPEAVPEELRYLVGRLLAKSRDERPSSASQVIEELEAMAATVAQPFRTKPVQSVKAGKAGRLPSTWNRAAGGDKTPARPPGRIRRSSWLRMGLAGLAVSAAGAALLTYGPARQGILDRLFASGQTKKIRDTGSSTALSGIAVLDFHNQKPKDLDNDWMCGALQTAFSTELGKVKSLRVYSRESMEAAAPSGNVTMEVARGLGASKFISGSFAVHGGKIRVDARLVDTATGMQEGAESIEGGLDEFFDLQKQLALRMLTQLPVKVSEVERAAIAKANPSENKSLALDAYKNLLQGEGLGEEEDEPEGAAEPRSGPTSSRRPSLLELFGVGVALAAEDPNAAPRGPGDARASNPREEVELTLENYRRALEGGDLDSIGKARGKLSDSQRDGLKKYFENAEKLQVKFSAVEIEEIDPSRFRVSYVRHDKFADRRTGETVSLEVRMENAVIRKGEQWIVASKKALAKP